MSNQIKILAFAGSLRKESYNKALIKIAQKVTPENAEIKVLDLEGIPLFNEDVEAQGLPEKVQDFRDKIESADALLIAAPEYNNFMSGVLVNALNWASRTIGDSKPLSGKPVAVMSASTSGYGGVRAQVHMKAVSFPLHIHLLDNFSVTVSNAQDKFGANGNLLDDHIRDKVRQLMSDLVNWTIRLKR